MSDVPNPFASPQTRSEASAVEQWSAQHPEALRKVKLGLTLVYAGICGILLVAIGFPILMFSGGPDLMASLGTVMAILMVALGLLMFVGQVLCIAVPEQSGARMLIVASVALQGLSFVFTLLMVTGLLGTAVGVAISLLGNLLSVASLVCFVLFLKKVAQYIDRYDIAAKATRSLIVGLISAAGLAASPLLALLGIGIGGLASLLILGCAIGALVALVMYANTITYLRKAIKV